MISNDLSRAMQRVNGLLQAGAYSEASTELEAIVALHPGHGEAQRLLAGTKLALGDLGAAERILRKAATAHPVWPPVLTMLGELLLHDGRHAQAEPFLLRAATESPADPRAALVLARRYNLGQRHAQALKVIAPFCQSKKASPELTEQHVTALVALGRSEEAVSIYQNIVKESPDNTAALYALATALQASKQHQRAEREVRRAIDRGCQSAALLHSLARSLEVLGKFEHAEEVLRQCLRLEPRRIDAHNDLARLVWIRTGDSTQATATFDTAIARFGNDDALWAAKAAILLGAGESRAAYLCLDERASRPQAPPALLVRAGLAALEFDPEAAGKLAARVLRILPGDPAARRLMVASQLGTGDVRGALPLCEALRREQPDNQYLITLQTTAWRMLGDERYARLCDYRKLAVPYRIEPPPPWTHLDDFLADLQQALGKLHDALRHRLLFRSLRSGTETMGELTDCRDPAIQGLFRAFDAPVRDYMARIGRGPDPLSRRNNGTYRFSGSWSVRLHGTGFHNNHAHPRGWISSACYIALPDNVANPQTRDGALTFGEPGILTTPVLQAEHEVQPEAGMLVLFPSYFWHGTVPFSGNQTRLTVAFDAVPDQTV